MSVLAWSRFQRLSLAWSTTEEKGDWLPAWFPLEFREPNVAAGCLSPFSVGKPWDVVPA